MDEIIKRRSNFKPSKIIISPVLKLAYTVWLSHENVALEIDAEIPVDHW